MWLKSFSNEQIERGGSDMREMKDSGIEWIGEIPCSWRMKRGKYLFNQRSSKGNAISLQLLSPTQKFGVIPQSLYEEKTGMNAVKLKDNADLSMLKTLHKGTYKTLVQYLPLEKKPDMQVKPRPRIQNIQSRLGNFGD